MIFLIINRGSLICFITQINASIIFSIVILKYYCNPKCNASIAMVPLWKDFLIYLKKRCLIISFYIKLLYTTRIVSYLDVLMHYDNNFSIIYPSLSTPPPPSYEGLGVYDSPCPFLYV